jgi:hypothetical protein
MEANILMELVLLALMATAIINCQRKTQQGISWVYPISIGLSILLISVSLFMIYSCCMSLNKFTFTHLSSLIVWSTVLVTATYNLLKTKKVDINQEEVVITPLIGPNKKHTLCKALYYTIINKYGRYYNWKELTICFKSNKVSISSLEHEDYVDIYNKLISHGIPEKKTAKQH